jgi:arylsulfatase A-like enzyme
METFAGYTAQTDYEVGRVLAALEEVNQTEDTLLFWEIGDNGASFEGGLYGSFNEMVSRHPDRSIQF